MSLGYFEFQDDGVKITLWDWRDHSERTMLLAYDRIQKLPEFTAEEHKRVSTSYYGKDVQMYWQAPIWIPPLKQSILLDAFVVVNEQEHIHAYKYNTPPPPSVSLVSDRDMSLLQISLIDTQNEVLQAIRSGGWALESLSARQFEMLVAAILRNHGYKVELTQCTRDGGYDIFALSENPCGLDLRIIIECKRYKQERPVGISVVRQLWGTLNSPTISADRGIIATTSRLSRDASNFVESVWRLSAWESSDILRFAGFKETKAGLWVPD
jgi:hypothetical protein